MAGRRKIIAALLGGLAWAGSIYADMVPASQLACGYRQVSSVTSYDTLPPTDWSGLSLDDPDGKGPEPALFDLWPRQTEADLGTTAQPQPVQILADGQDSFSLCLYALLGLGLCRSAPLVKKFSFGYIPQWYHDGGPTQIGPSLAISPDCLCAVPVCLVRPAAGAEDHLPRYHFASVVSRWRKSQFAPATLASRAPPAHS